MPKKANVKKAASAQYQNIKALAEAASGADGMEYLSVQKILGNRYFLCVNALGYTVLAEPRKLFTRGSMRVAVGGIVVAQAPTLPDWKKDMIAQQRAEHQAACSKAKQNGGAEPVANMGLPYEIVGVIQERSEARRLIRAKMMPQAVLDQALAAEAGPAGAAATEAAAANFEFMTPEEVAKAEKAEALAAMTPEQRARLAQLKAEKQKALGTFEGTGLDLDDELPEHGAKADAAHHASRGMRQARAAADSRTSIQQRLTALLNGAKKSAGIRIAEGEELAAKAAAEEDGDELVGPSAKKQGQFRPKKDMAAAAEAAAEAAAALRHAEELDELIEGLMGPPKTVERELQNEASFESKVAALRAELAALPEVDDWETAADAEELAEIDLADL